MLARLFLLVAMVGLFVVIGTSELDWFSVRDEERQDVQTPSSNRVRVPLTKKETPMEVSGTISETATLSTAIGGVVPHHLVASSMLADFFSLLSKRAARPTTILLLAPNHFEVGEATIQTTPVLWETAFGTVETDPELLRDVREGGAEIQPETFIEEHGIYNILPYVAHFLPGAKVVPVVFRYDMTTLEREQFIASILPRIRTGEVFVVSSIDFSHYLPQAEAERKDKETWEALQDFDLSKIARFGSDHLDSPGAMLTLLRIGQELQATNLTVLRHGNSADTIRGRNSSTTSHFTIILSKK